MAAAQNAAGSPTAASASPPAAAPASPPLATSPGGGSSAPTADWETTWQPDYAPFPSPLHYLAWSLYHSAHFPRKHLPEVLAWLHKGVFSGNSNDSEAMSHYKTVLNQTATLHPLVEPQVFRANDGTALAWVRHCNRESRGRGGGGAEVGGGWGHSTIILNRFLLHSDHSSTPVKSCTPSCPTLTCGQRCILCPDVRS